MAVLKHGSLIFEWDDDKAESNMRKHGVTFVEAAGVFHDDFALLKADTIHSSEEARFLLMGLSLEQNILVIVYVERGEKLRIISARRATPRERRDYEQGNMGR